MVSHATESNPHGDAAARATTELHEHLDSLAAQQPEWTARTLNTVLPEQPAKPLLFGRHREMRDDATLPRKMWFCSFQVTV